MNTNTSLPIPTKEMERALIKKFRKYLWSPFIRAIIDFEMIQQNDRIAIAISGGKDSLVMAKLMQELYRHSDIPFEPVFISMNPGFSKENESSLIANCKAMDIPVHFFQSDIFEVTTSIAKENPCYMCARMRRGHLYAKAKELGCNKIALGHHFDDVIETTLINMLYAGTMKTMTPKVPSTSGKLELIRPLIYVKEADIIDYTKTNGIRAMNCGCTIEAGKTSSKRREVKNLLAELEEKNPGVKQSVFNSMRNINLDYVFGYTGGNVNKDK